MKTLTILSHNIGHFYLIKFWRHIKLWTNNKVFFLHKDIPLIKSMVKKIKPDIIFLQELTWESDAKVLANRLWYKFYSFFKSSHLNNEDLGTGILHNFEKGIIKTQKNNIAIHSLNINEYNFINIHLTPFSKHKRLKQIKELINYTKKHQKQKHIISWDFNLKNWKNIWLNKIDKQAYETMNKMFNDSTKSILSTHKYWFKFDYLFCSKKINIFDINCIKKVNNSMDHYPISGKIKIQ
jgi:endonuclease/exonuclease/phosphatase family metal-dependent hydrolase